MNKYKQHNNFHKFLWILNIDCLKQEHLISKNISIIFSIFIFFCIHNGSHNKYFQYYLHLSYIHLIYCSISPYKRISSNFISRFSALSNIMYSCGEQFLAINVILCSARIHRSRTWSPQTSGATKSWSITVTSNDKLYT